MDFEPFGERLLTSLREPDLTTLCEVAEGWYVEYKREVPAAEAVAKSISAMANTYGGWVFYGVDEKSKDHAVAGSFPGVALADLDALLMRIRGAVAQGVNPSPHYDVHVIRAEGGGLLDEGRGVIVVRVPRSVNTPHLHRSGRVFRRVGDASEPAAENDRSRLDELFRRREKLEQRYVDLFADALPLPEHQATQPLLRLMLVTDVFRDRDAFLDQSVGPIREIMGRPERDVAAMPFDTVHTTLGGFIARQLANNAPDGLTSTWELHRNLDSVITVPLRTVRADHPDSLDAFLDGYASADEFRACLDRDRHRAPRILDLNALSAVLTGIAHIQAELMAPVGETGSVFFRAELVNLAGCVPFLDVPRYMDALRHHAAPICLRNRIAVPTVRDLDSFLTTPPIVPVDGVHPILPVLAMAHTILLFLMWAIGLPVEFEAKEDGGPTYFEELREASLRFNRAQAAERLREGR